MKEVWLQRDSKRELSGVWMELFSNLSMVEVTKVSAGVKTVIASEKNEFYCVYIKNKF